MINISCLNVGLNFINMSAQENKNFNISFYDNNKLVNECSKNGLFVMKSEEFGSISIIKPKYDQYLYQINNDDFKSKISLTFDMDKCKKMEVFYENKDYSIEFGISDKHILSTYTIKKDNFIHNKIEYIKDEEKKLEVIESSSNKINKFIFENNVLTINKDEFEIPNYTNILENVLVNPLNKDKIIFVTNKLDIIFNGFIEYIYKNFNIYNNIIEKEYLNDYICNNIINYDLNEYKVKVLKKIV